MAREVRQVGRMDAMHIDFTKERLDPLCRKDVKIQDILHLLARLMGDRVLNPDDQHVAIHIEFRSCPGDWLQVFRVR